MTAKILFFIGLVSMLHALRKLNPTIFKDLTVTATCRENGETYYFDANKDSWNKRTAVHKDSAFYDLEGFKQGGSSLNKIELLRLTWYARHEAPM